MPDIVILTEHNLDTERLNKTNIPGYSLRASFSRYSHRKGGVAIYTADTLGDTVVALDITDLCKELTCEIAAIQIKTKTKTMYITAIYRPPRGKLDEALEILNELLEVKLKQNTPTILMGDINVNNLILDREDGKLAEMLAGHNMVRMNLPPTRITPHSVSSIDCVCTNMPTDNIKVTVMTTGISDHTAQLVKLDFPTAKATTRGTIKRKINNNTLQQLKSLLQYQSWEDLHTDSSVDEAYNTFSTTLTALMDIACPKTLIRPKRKNNLHMFMDKELARLKEDFLKALHNYEITGSEINKREVAAKKKLYDLKLKALRRHETICYINRSDNKPKALWEVINKEISCKTDDRNNKLHLKINDKLLDNPQEIADHFNSYFTTIAEETLKQNGQLTQRGTRTPEATTNSLLISLAPTTYEEVRKIIRSLKPKTSCGLDDVSTKLLKHCAEELTPPLVKIFNLSFKHGQFPSALKITKTYPKFKKGSKTDIGNYRPISLVPTFSKVIEKVVLLRLMKHLKRNNLLTDKQHGFLQGKSTKTAMIKLVEYIIDAIESGNYTSGILLDLSKAFDCLNHELAIKKLTSLGIEGRALKWFKNYLGGRSQIVELRDWLHGVERQIRSTPRQITRGVPQGSVLGPLLFILYTNDLPSILQEYSDILMYADDTTLLVNRTTAMKTEIDSFIALNMAFQFCHENDLAVNPSKSKQLTFGKKGKNIAEIPEIEKESETNFLGVTIDENLSWTPHINGLCKKLSTGIFVVRRIRAVSDIPTAKTAYHALVESHLRYGLIVWGGTSAENLQRILNLQKRAVRTICMLGPQDSCREHFKSLKILTIVCLYIREVIFHAVNQEPPRCTDLHSYDTRHTTQIALPIHGLTLSEKKPIYNGCRMYNHLPDSIRRLKGNTFKKTLTQWLLEKTFYTTAEFYDNV